MKIFVTGATGWIGSHLTPLLVENGHTILALARSDSSASPIPFPPHMLPGLIIDPSGS
ncbi:hypothetical protein B9479_001576 [Cryptococcus floricola]|uniref:NAD-dependent epimerase/dehydratase domain-containing protein n=1 Tax=Cryptococcus floricola TaxID=2591691 RepID=A0A5D3B3W7_9TREE|nr:hypothetical protein B9479_001576 [Cryptococcus floricola]